MIGQTRPNSHKIFASTEQEYHNFEAHQYFKTTK